jgi:molecular chaperone GrpE
VSDEEEDGPKIEASEEMQDALREATESVSDRRSGSGGGSADKLTIEMLSNELQAMKDEFESRGKQLEEAQDRYVRLQAEFENFRRRSLKERQESLQYGQQNLVKDLLGAVDNLERALEHAEQNADADLRSLLQGVELVHREILGVLGKHGVQSIDPQAAAFDPTYHEAMGQVPDATVEPNTVTQVLQKGYLLKDRMLRPARVMVARAPTDEEVDAKKQDEQKDG